ncbi:MAG: undecaprenyldiphospho-muramoylpentapeptide beta-N-acetylglucosaminyltransferase [Hyphomicrobiales bacterium]|nr:undecaprenyldiphospho-muramoylpentapeptide beta-N-acetylglucosaminyltransferase [Hyphomicrobiales bacterium]
MNERPIVVAAGGTGGHLFPAESLAHALVARGRNVELVTDTRAEKYGQAFPAQEIHSIPAATPTGGSVVARTRAVATLGRGVIASMTLMRRIKPSIVVGFGGYPTVPPVLAATLLKIPTVLHEQNAVMGRANRFLARRVDRIATGFPLARGEKEILAKSVVTGNPLRPAVFDAAKQPYPDFFDGRLRVLVTGGSQGARVFSDIVPAAIEQLEPQERARIALTQQARGEDESRVREIYGRIGFSAEVAPFFKDLPGRIAGAHLMIARSGASTVAEIAGIGRPAILVPFPFALDADQAANAAELARTGAVEVVDQTQFTVEKLVALLRAALSDPAGLTKRAEAAKSAGILDAAERLADIVIATIDSRGRK